MLGQGLPVGDAIATELAGLLQRKALGLQLVWYPRELDSEADALTNSDFSCFTASNRVPADGVLGRLKILNSILIKGQGFEDALLATKAAASPSSAKRRASEKGVGQSAPQSLRKRRRLEGGRLEGEQGGARRKRTAPGGEAPLRAGWMCCLAVLAA